MSKETRAIEHIDSLIVSGNWPIRYEGDYEFSTTGKRLLHGDNSFFLDQSEKDFFLSIIYDPLKEAITPKVMTGEPGILKKALLEDVQPLINKCFLSIKNNDKFKTLLDLALDKTFISKWQLTPNNKLEQPQAELLTDFQAGAFFYALMSYSLGEKIFSQKYDLVAQFIIKAANFHHIFNHSFENNIEKKQEVTGRKFNLIFGFNPKFSMLEKNNYIFKGTDSRTSFYLTDVEKGHTELQLINNVNIPEDLKQVNGKDGLYVIQRKKSSRCLPDFNENNKNNNVVIQKQNHHHEDEYSEFRAKKLNEEFEESQTKKLSTSSIVSFFNSKENEDMEKNSNNQNNNYSL